MERRGKGKGRIKIRTLCVLFGHREEGGGMGFRSLLNESPSSRAIRNRTPQRVKVLVNYLRFPSRRPFVLSEEEWCMRAAQKHVIADYANSKDFPEFCRTKCRIGAAESIVDYNGYF
ncbi:hypothetical protein TNIN_235611 [Trichonephila inaurata madagascariensis]|uniref:Uncharacterized protein n=1 Tax=Trichonephila inaurata madagascariensis TaxID=2747483 RepID=A0A8X7CMH5_9ARAC|nr:hypothetical protein TNIN_235611 [Trichonephila inaurata madagascariensis]